jgi:hypothetical protein
MIENPHFKELLQRFYANSVRYLIVGGYAVMKYSEPRFTKDLGVRVESRLFGTTVFFISLDDLILNKESTGRSSDLDHLKSIRETRE